MMDFADAVFGEAAAFQAYGVEAVGAGAALGGGFGEGQDVAGDGGASANEGVSADADEMMDGAEGSDGGPVFDGDVAAEGGGVGHDDVAADLAIVRDVGVGHDQVVVADSGAGSAFDGAAVDGDELADHVVAADFEAGGFAGVGDVLRGEADGAEGEELIVRSDSGCALDDYVGGEMAGFS